jgi:hypothetical protein
MSILSSRKISSKKIELLHLKNLPKINPILIIFFLGSLSRFKGQDILHWPN